MNIRQKKGDNASIIVRFALLLLVLFGAALPKAVLAQSSNPVPVQFFYVPIPEDQLLLALQTVQSGAGSTPSNPIQTYMSLAATSDNTVIYFDQWENGYDPDISNPLNLYSVSNPGGTQIWGDGNPANGAPPGVPGDVINSGTVILLNNPVTTTNLLAIDFDGGDKIAATKTIAMVRSGWSTGPNTLLAAANETYDTDNWGTSFVVPVGEDMPVSFDNRLFGYTGLSIMAGVGGANVQVDADANGSYELSFSLAEGKAYLVNGGINVGAKVLSSKPVQIDLLTGDRGEQYETRFFGLTPTNLLYSQYYTPVSTPSSAQGTSGTSTVVFLYNPGNSSITVNYTTRTGSGGNTLTTSPITVSAGGYARQVIPDGYGASFVSTNGAVFHALSATDADNTNTSTGGNRTWDWGYSLIGNGALTPQVLVGLGIGRDPTSGTNPSENGNPVWVTPVGNGNTAVTIYIDYDANPTTGPLTDPNGNKYNTSVSLRELDRAKVYDATDNNQTGMLVYTLTNGVKLAAAWGQDPLVASASAPGLDMGTGIPPVPLYDAGKNGTLYQDNDGDGFISPGDVLEYKIVLNNISRAPVPDITLFDDLPADVVYVPNSTFFKNHLGTVSQISDDGSGTAFPLDGSGKLINPSSALPVGKSYEITFRATIKNFEDLTPGIEIIINTGHADAVGTSVEFTAHTPLFGRIGDKVWNDLNQNGIQDPAETGVQNIIVKLLDGSGNVVATDTTDANGIYTFFGVLPGNYRVEFAKPSTSNFTTQNADAQGINGPANSDPDPATGKTALFALAGGERNNNIDAGMYPKSTIGDKVWNDANQNGIQDAGETGISGVTVKLYDNSNNLIATTTTDANGNYAFANVNPGSYYVEFTAPAGQTFTTKDAGSDETKDSDADPATGKTAVFTLAPGQSNFTVDAGMYTTPASIGNRVWNDTNKNGIQDAGEPGLPNKSVILFDSGNNQIAITTTDANGEYSFTNVAPGNYYVQFGVPFWYLFSPKDAGSNDQIDSDADPLSGNTAVFTLAPGQVDNSRDAGMYVNTGSIGDKVWNDANHNGIQDAGENGLANVTVNLYHCDGNLVATTTTDANGNYTFTNLPPTVLQLASESYYVQFVAPSGYQFAAKDAGSDDTKDSDADPLTGSTTCFQLNPGQNDVTRDAGLYLPYGVIGDYVWNDTDGNGVQGNTEVGLPNITVKLYDSNDNLIAATTTDSSGAYSFTNVLPGDYYVSFTAPQYYIISPKDVGGDDAKDSDADQLTGKTAVFTLNPGQVNTSIDAGMKLNSGVVGDFTWIDSNFNGIQDIGESDLPGVKVQLFDCNDNLIATTFSRPHGEYTFFNVIPGNYYVKFTPPAGYIFSPALQGADSLLDSDANPATGKTSCFFVAPGSWDASRDAGMKLSPVTIGNYVWNDLNGNGIQNAGEPGIPNVTVHLYDVNENIVATTTTDANGYYAFTNVAPGDYGVRFVLPSGYSFSPVDNSPNDEEDSDVNPDGKTGLYTFAPGEVNNSIDAGMKVTATDIQVTKTASVQSIACGQSFTYTIKAKNIGAAAATGVNVSEILPAGLDYQGHTVTHGTYDLNTGLWTIGTLAPNIEARLTITVAVNCSTLNLANIDLGPAKNYNVFALVDFKPSSADVQGRLAVGRDAVLGGYSVGDQLPPSGGTVDVLVVGRDLQFTSGGVWGGNVVYGNNSNLPASAVTIFDGTVRKDTVIDFPAAKSYLENLSTLLGSFSVNGTTTFQWGTLNLTHTDPYLNVFTINAADLNTAHTVQINVPNGSAVIVNVLGNNINWRGGLFVNGTVMNNVIYNFPQAANITISGIDVRGALLAPFADLNFPAGLISGQAIFKSMVGSGQFNLSPFLGNIPANMNVTNIASLQHMNETDTNPANNSSSVTTTVTTVSGGSGGGSGSGGWQLIGNLPVGETVTCLESDHQGGIYAGTVNGYIYKTADNGATWVRVNNDMYSGPVWAIEVHPNGSILAATVTGVYRGTNNGTTWELTALQYKDTRTLKIDAQGNVYAGTWGFGMYVSTNCGLTWTQSNTGLGTHLIVTAVTVTPNQNVFAGTFDGGVFKSIDQGANWTPVNVGYNYIWTLASNSDGDLFAGTYGDGLYRSVNNGGTWTKTSFPAAHVYELRVDASDNVFAASYSGGVFVSTNKGVSWTNIGMGGMALSSMMIVPNGRTMFTGTAGGQIYMKASNLTSAKGLNDEKPTAFALNQNYPNPFNPSTVVRYALPFEAKVNVRVYNIAGQEVAVLAQGTANAGNYEVSFEAKDLPSGLYICTMNAVSSDGKEKFNATRKMMLIK